MVLRKNRQVIEEEKIPEQGPNPSDFTVKTEIQSQHGQEEQKVPNIELAEVVIQESARELFRENSVKFSRMQHAGSIRSLGQFRPEVIRPHNMNDQQLQQVEARRNLPVNMDADTAARVEERRAAEAQQDAVVASEPPPVDMEKRKQDRKTNIFWSVLLAGIFALQANSEQLGFWQDNLPSVCYFYYLTIVLYLLSAANQYAFMKFETQDNYQLFTKIDDLNILFQMCFAIWGQTIVSSTEYERIKVISNAKFADQRSADLERGSISLFSGTFESCVFIRMLYIYFLAFAIFVLIVFFWFNRQQGRVQPNVDRIVERLPVVSSFLKTKAKNYTEADKAKNPDTTECVICYEEFSTQDGKEIVELACNDKHIFHLECIDKWMEENSSCPMCREEIKEQ